MKWDKEGGLTVRLTRSPTNGSFFPVRPYLPK